MMGTIAVSWAKYSIKRKLLYNTKTFQMDNEEACRSNTYSRQHRLCGLPAAEGQAQPEGAVHRWQCTAGSAPLAVPRWQCLAGSASLAVPDEWLIDFMAAANGLRLSYYGNISLLVIRPYVLPLHS